MEAESNLINVESRSQRSMDVQEAGPEDFEHEKQTEGQPTELSAPACEPHHATRELPR